MSRLILERAIIAFAALALCGLPSATAFNGVLAAFCFAHGALSVIVIGLRPVFDADDQSFAHINGRR